MLQLVWEQSILSLSSSEVFLLCLNNNSLPCSCRPQIYFSPQHYKVQAQSYLAWEDAMGLSMMWLCIISIGISIVNLSAGGHVMMYKCLHGLHDKCLLLLHVILVALLVRSAFFNGDPEEVWLSGFVLEGKFCSVSKASYGPKYAPRAWYQCWQLSS